MLLPLSCADLVRKYTELTALRREREALEAQGVRRLDGSEGDARKARVRALAAEFPGCLRELEGMNAEQLDARREAVAQGQEPLVSVLALFHGGLREALLVRRKERSCGPGTLELRVLDAAGATQCRAAPGGRLSEGIWSWLGARWGASPVALKAWIYDDAPSPLVGRS